MSHLCDCPWSFVDLHEGPGHREAALWKDHDFAAFLQFVHQYAERHRIRRVDRDHVEQGKCRLRPPALGNIGVDGEGCPFGQEG